MTPSKKGEAGSAVPTVHDLLEKRNRILGWLARLDEEEDAESRRVVERVRADYRQRLQAVVDDLSVHLESLRAELDGARERSAAAESRHAEAEDALREARLRHRIGELDEAEWESRRGGLEEAVASAAAEREESGEEVARLEEVLAQIDSGAVEAPTPEVEAVVEEVLVVEAEPELAVEEGPGDDLAFLEELDRAIAASGEPTDPEPEEQREGEEEPEDEIRPRKGMKCLECGYTNDVTAWYCGVCGVELP